MAPETRSAAAARRRHGSSRSTTADAAPLANGFAAAHENGFFVGPADRQPPADATAASSGHGVHRKGRSSGTGSHVGLFATGVASSLAWMAASSGVIVFNKRLYTIGFDQPSMVTGMGQVFSALGGLLMSAAGVLPLRGPPSPAFFVRHLLPVVLSTAATMFLGNYAYLWLSVAFVQILKAFTPAITLLAGVAAGLETPTPALLSSVTLIALGTGGAVAVESGAPTFHWIGFASFMGSSLTEATRVVGAQQLLQHSSDEDPYNAAESLVYIGSPAAVLLIAWSLLFEAPLSKWRIAAAAPWPCACAFSLSMLTNLFSFVAIATTSSLTFKIMGTLKNLAVIWYGIAFQGDTVTGAQVMGYLLGASGFVMYSHMKATAAAHKGAKHKRM